MKPLNSRVIIAPDFHPKQIGSIYLPENLKYRDLPNTGRILEMPDGSFDFKAGERVLYDQHASNFDSGLMDDAGKPHALVPVSSVLAVLQ